MPTDLPNRLKIKSAPAPMPGVGMSAAMLAFGALLFTGALSVFFLDPFGQARRAEERNLYEKSLRRFVRTPGAGEAFAAVMSECVSNVYRSKVTVSFGGFTRLNRTRIEVADYENMIALAASAYDLTKEGDTGVTARLMLLPGAPHITPVPLRDNSGALRDIDARLFVAAEVCQRENSAMTVLPPPQPFLRSAAPQRDPH